MTGYNDITPRISSTYDVFGNGRTAFKVNLAKYLEAATNGVNYSGPNPLSRITTVTTRSFNDANKNFAPDCNLLNPAANGECGAMSSQTFGQNVFSNTYDPAILHGWGVRPADWNLGVAVQQQILPRASLEVGYYRRWFSGFTVTDNLAVAPSDFGLFSVTAPQAHDCQGAAGKILRFGHTRTNVGLDIHNLTNSAAVQTYNQSFIAGGSWLVPTLVMPSRFAKVSAQIDF